MSSSRFPRTPRSRLAEAAIAAVLATCGAAGAQALPPSPPVVPPVPADGAFPTGPGQAAPAAAKPIALPDGASIDGAAERVKALAAEADRDLKALVGDAVTPEEEAEIGARTERRRRIDVLADRLEEAKIAKELWKELNGDDSEADERVAALEAEKAELERQLRDASAPAAAAAPADPLPVVARVSGAGQSVSATILVPYVGEMRASVGTVLPSGHRVASIGPSGVTVTKGGTATPLVFGTSVPGSRPVAPALPGTPPVR